MEKKTAKKAKKKLPKLLNSKQQEAKWFALRCFNKEDKDQVGFLAINLPEKTRDLYEIVESVDDAAKFPSKNVYGMEGFGTPQQWLEFFKEEGSLSEWEFHLVSTSKPH